MHDDLEICKSAGRMLLVMRMPWGPGAAPHALYPTLRHIDKGLVFPLVARYPAQTSSAINFQARFTHNVRRKQHACRTNDCCCSVSVFVLSANLLPNRPPRPPCSDACATAPHLSIQARGTDALLDTQEKPYPCRICGKTFARASVLIPRRPS